MRSGLDVGRVARDDGIIADYTGAVPILAGARSYSPPLNTPPW
jgi:hypothetical protein